MAQGAGTEVNKCCRAEVDLSAARGAENQRGTATVNIHDFFVIAFVQHQRRGGDEEEVDGDYGDPRDQDDAEPIMCTCIERAFERWSLHCNTKTSR